MTPKSHLMCIHLSVPDFFRTDDNETHLHAGVCMRTVKKKCPQYKITVRPARVKCRFLREAEAMSLGIEPGSARVRVRVRAVLR